MASEVTGGCYNVFATFCCLFIASAALLDSFSDKSLASVASYKFEVASEVTGGRNNFCTTFSHLFIASAESSALLDLFSGKSLARVASYEF